MPYYATLGTYGDNMDYEFTQHGTVNLILNERCNKILIAIPVKRCFRKKKCYNFFCRQGKFLHFTSAEVSEKSSRWLWKESCGSTAMR